MFFRKKGKWNKTHVPHPVRASKKNKANPPLPWLRLSSPADQERPVSSSGWFRHDDVARISESHGGRGWRFDSLALFPAGFQSVSNTPEQEKKCYSKVQVSIHSAPVPNTQASSSSSSSAFPRYIFGVHHVGWDLCVCDCFNPTIEVVTFRLRGWCMLGVFLMLAFTRLGHECQDLPSPCNGMHVCTNWTSVYTLV